MIAIDECAMSAYPAYQPPMPKKADEKIAKVMVGVRLTQRDPDRLDAIRAEIGIATRHAIAREALRIGLDALEEDSTRRARPDDMPAPARRRRPTRVRTS